MKTKICAIILASLFVGASFTYIVGAVELQGKIDVSINDFMGGVSPKINLNSDQTLDIEVEFDGEKYKVNTTLTINLDITDNSKRGWIPWLFARRAVVYTQLVRPEQKLLPLMGFLYRRLPLYKGLRNILLAGGKLHFIVVSPSVLGNLSSKLLKRSQEIDTSIDMKLNYDITDMVNPTDGNTEAESEAKGFETLDVIASEKMILRIATAGLLLPSNVNGFQLLHIIDFQRVNLTVNYLSPVAPN
jgi:hypothetical protein